MRLTDTLVKGCKSSLRLARSVIRTSGKMLFNTGLRPLTIGWRPYSRLILVADSARWVIGEELREVAAVSSGLGVKVVDRRWVDCSARQAVFYGSHFSLLQGEFPKRAHRHGMAYFHGKPGTGIPEFDESYAKLCQIHQHIHRVQVSHTEMRDIILESGIDPAKVFLIPIGINTDYFQIPTPEMKRTVRSDLGIPESAVVVGSFQKDGNGWGEGLTPKLIKGPDVFLEAIEVLKNRVPELFVLLTGPARGYVKAGLENMGTPYKHVLFDSYRDVPRMFHCLDLYIVASRQEGGPKAILESMASGVPIVTTRVGQATDLVKHQYNGWLADVEDAEALAHFAERAISDGANAPETLKRGRLTAEANSYEAQIPLWRQFMTGFVEFDE